MKKNYFLLMSVIVNIILLGIFFMYMFTSWLDWAVMIKSTNRLCTTIAREGGLLSTNGQRVTPSFCK